MEPVLQTDHGNPHMHQEGLNPESSSRVKRHRCPSWRREFGVHPVCTVLQPNVLACGHVPWLVACARQLSLPKLANGREDMDEGEIYWCSCWRSRGPPGFGFADIGGQDGARAFSQLRPNDRTKGCDQPSAIWPGHLHCCSFPGIHLHNFHTHVKLLVLSQSLEIQRGCKHRSYYSVQCDGEAICGGGGSL